MNAKNCSRYYLLNSEGYALYTSDDAKSDHENTAEKKHFFDIRPMLATFLAEDDVFLASKCSHLDLKLSRYYYRVNPWYSFHFKHFF